MGFIEEMQKLLRHTGNIKTVEEIKKEYGRANTEYKYFIEIYNLEPDEDYNIHYDYKYFGSNKFNDIINNHNMVFDWLDGSTIGINHI